MGSEFENLDFLRDYQCWFQLFFPNSAFRLPPSIYFKLPASSTFLATLYTLNSAHCSPLLSQLLECVLHETSDRHLLGTPLLGRSVVHTSHLLANSMGDFLKTFFGPMTVTIAA